jgi:hypothetical protein
LLNKKLKKEVKESMKFNGIENIEEKLIIWYGFAEYQMKQDTYQTPCEDCDNPNCKKKEDFPIMVLSRSKVKVQILYLL